jgi:hypothetical protein
MDLGATAQFRGKGAYSIGDGNAGDWQRALNGSSQMSLSARANCASATGRHFHVSDKRIEAERSPFVTPLNAQALSRTHGPANEHRLAEA